MDVVEIGLLGVFVPVGFCMAAWGIHCVVRSRKAARWPVVEGTVHSCELKSFVNDGTTMWEVIVNYSYRVSGREYHGTRIAFGYTGSGSQTKHTPLYDKLAKARIIAVRYNPNDPAQAILSWQYGGSAIVSLLMGILFLSILTDLPLSPESTIVFWCRCLTPFLAFGMYFAVDGRLVSALIDRIEIREQKGANQAPEDTARKLADPQH